MADITVSVVSADREIWSGTASMIVARTKIGQIGILAGHEPVLAILDDGDVRVTTTGGQVVTAHAADGFLSFEHDRATVVARNASLA